VVWLYMAGDDIVDTGRIDDGGDALEEFFGEYILDGINQGDLIIEDQISVVRGTSSSLVTVETAHGPVNGANPVYVFSNFNCLHGKASLSII
jgi:hypothetical protein